jgi:glycosyltransferase involved in cell wall biosynthesis
MIAIPSLGAGGAERVVSTLANALISQGDAVKIVTFDNQDDRPYYELHPEVELIQLDLPASSPKLSAQATRTAGRIRALRRTFFEKQPDIVVSFLTKMNIMSVAASSGLGVPVVISERNNPVLQRTNMIWRLMRRLTYPKAVAFVAPTQRAADTLPTRLRPRTTVIPNPVGLNYPDRTSDGRTLTAVGRLAPQKRFDLLLDAFARLAPRFPEWRLEIWGEGPERVALERQRDALGLSNRVSLPGVSSNPGEWTASADVFVMTSEYEGWANVLAEALAAGVPAVAFDCPFGPREILGKNNAGVLVPFGDVAALAESLAQLLENPGLRAHYSKNGRKRAADFQIDDIAACWRELFEDALSAHAKLYAHRPEA